MYELIIQNYINNLSKDDIIYFALKNNIQLNNIEVDAILSALKRDYKILLSDEYENIFLREKEKLSKENYNKILNLYLIYRHKYKNFLK